MKKQNKILLVQPHSDDVLFSASKFLLNREDYGSVVLLTVENSPLRNKEDEELANLFNLKDIHLEGLVNDESYYHFYKEDKKRVFSFKKSYESIKEYLGNDKLKEIRKNLNKKVDYYKEFYPHTFYIFLHSLNDYTSRQPKKFYFCFVQ